MSYLHRDGGPIPVGRAVSHVSDYGAGPPVLPRYEPDPPGALLNGSSALNEIVRIAFVQKAQRYRSLPAETITDRHLAPAPTQGRVGLGAT